MSLPPYAHIVQDLPSTVPFVGPEAQERERAGRSAPASAPTRASSARRRRPSRRWPRRPPRPGSTAIPSSTTSRRRSPPTTASRRPTSCVGEGIDGLLGNLVRLLVAPGTPVVTSPAPIRPSTTTSRASAGGSSPCPTATTPRTRRRCSLAARKAGAPLVYLANPDNPMGSWHRRAHRRADRAAARRRGALPRRGLRRLRARRRPAAARRRRAAGASACAPSPRRTAWPGARVGYAIGAARGDRRLRPGAQPFRRQPHRPGRRARRARRPRLAGAGGGAGRARPRAASPRSPRANGLHGAALGDQLRDHRLRPRRRLRAARC